MGVSRLRLISLWVAWPCLVLAGCRSAPKEPVTTKPVVAVEAPAGPTFAGCPLFPADNVWNTRIDTLPKDPHSDAYLDSIGITQRLHADFGSRLVSGIPVTMAPEDVPPAKIKFQYDSESDHVAYPLFPGVAIEGGYNSPGDRHSILVDSKNCLLYEIWHTSILPNKTWTAGSGIRMDLRSNALRKDGDTSADAAGLPILPGLVRFDEVNSGEIRHALRFTLPRAQHAYVWPARHQAMAGGETAADNNLNQPPFGVRLRLRADFDVMRYSTRNRVILRALQRYGMILADLGGGIYLSGSADERWNDDDLSLLERIKGQDFEVVDESSLRVASDSGQARQKP